MKPSIGRTVIVKNFSSNGTGEQPAVITRVWSGDMDPADGKPCGINVMVLPDCGTPQARSSLMLFESRAAYEAANVLSPLPGPVCFWPDRI